MECAPEAVAEISNNTELAQLKYLQKQLEITKEDINGKKAEINGKVAQMEQQQKIITD